MNKQLIDICGVVCSKSSAQKEIDFMYLLVKKEDLKLINYICSLRNKKERNEINYKRTEENK